MRWARRRPERQSETSDELNHGADQERDGRANQKNGGGNHQEDEQKQRGVSTHPADVRHAPAAGGVTTNALMI